MPGWHRATKQLVKEGKLQVIGVIQEQHPDRCRLFAQWQKFDWPIVHDPINVFGNSAVPIAIAIDEHGIVRSTRPRADTFVKEFVDVPFDNPDSDSRKTTRTSVGVSPEWKSIDRAIEKKEAKGATLAAQLRKAADSRILWGNEKQLDQAIALYEKSLEIERGRGATLFRLGVAYQMRYESPVGQSGDFGKAVKYWRQGLAANPNQYIWRRRIQQYGPRLDKPYPFYDWVADARKEIISRGEKPIQLRVEPVGAELASKASSLEETGNSSNPDADGKVIRDANKLIQISSVVVPNTSRQHSAMIHLILDPKPFVTWSNEAGPLKVWVDGKKVRQSQKLFSVTNRNQLESTERRKIEFEIAAKPGTKTIEGFALYYVCEKSGACRFLRQDFTISLE